MFELGDKMAKIFTFKGKTFEELQRLSLEEFARLLPAREKRKLLKRGMMDEEKNLIRKIREKKGFVKTHCREMVIIPEMVGAKIGLYNGKDWITIEVKQEMVGHRLGEFALTRKRVQHSAPGIGATKSSKYIPLK